MNLLQVFFIVSGIIIFLLSLDIAKKQRFNALHFIVFIAIGIGLLLFTFNHGILQSVGSIFGLQRGADVLVYASIVFLLYFSLLLLRKSVENRDDVTLLVRELCLLNSPQKRIQGKEVFLVRVYNESTVIGDVLQGIFDAGYKNILVVNDGSLDDSKEVLEGYKGKIFLLHHAMNRGAGAALETGFEYIRRYGDVEYIVCFDADGQHDVGDARGFFNVLDGDRRLDIVIGSRFIQKTKSNVPFGRRIILFLGSIFTFFISSIKLSDSHNGYRVIRRRVLDRMRLTMDGMEYASELIENIYKYKLKFKEVPVNILYTDYSLGKGQKNRNAINIAFKIIWNKFFR